MTPLITDIANARTQVHAVVAGWGGSQAPVFAAEPLTDEGQGNLEVAVGKQPRLSIPRAHSAAVSRAERASGMRSAGSVTVHAAMWSWSSLPISLRPWARR